MCKVVSKNRFQDFWYIFLGTFWRTQWVKIRLYYQNSTIVLFLGKFSSFHSIQQMSQLLYNINISKIWKLKHNKLTSSAFVYVVCGRMLWFALTGFLDRIANWPCKATILRRIASIGEFLATALLGICKKGEENTIKSK